MYDNIGEKIKGLAKFVAILGSIAMILLGIFLFAEDEDLIPLGLVVFFFGPVFSWILSWLTYGFGELIDKTCNIERCICKGSSERIYDKNPPKNPKTDDESENKRLEKLELLRVQGLITEEEYQQAVSKK